MNLFHMSTEVVHSRKSSLGVLATSKFTLERLIASMLLLMATKIFVRGEGFLTVLTLVILDVPPHVVSAASVSLVQNEY